MSKNKLSRYDIAISFTEKDNAVAQKMATALRKKGMKVYYYKRNNQYGENLDKITPKVYRNGSNYGLVILSREYRKKTVPMAEWREIRKGKKTYRVKKIFIIKIEEDANLPGLRPTTIYEKWNDNPSEIARRIKQQVDFPSFRTFKLLIATLLLLLILTGVYYSIELQLFE